MRVRSLLIGVLALFTASMAVPTASASTRTTDSVSRRDVDISALRAKRAAMPPSVHVNDRDLEAASRALLQRAQLNVFDATGDTYWSRGDLLGAAIDTVDIAGVPSLIAVSLVDLWTNPYDADWQYGDTWLAWNLDVNGDSTVDYTLTFQNYGGLLYGDLWNSVGTHLCDTDWYFDGTNQGYSVAVPLTCLKNPAKMRFFNKMKYVDTFVGTYSLDWVPDLGWSGWKSNTLRPAAAVAPKAPARPTLQAAPGALKVAWTGPTNPAGAPITDYQVQYANAATMVWKTAVDGVSTARSATIAGLSKNLHYVVRVRAKNSVGYGPFSPVSLAKTPLAPLQPPPAPTIPTLTAGLGFIKAAWTGPVNPVGAAVTDFQVQIAPAATLVWTTVPDGVSVLHNTVIRNLTSNVRYRVRVRARNSVGFGPFSPLSAALAPLAASPPGTPGKPVGTPGLGAVSVTWTAPATAGTTPITDYRVDVSRNNGATWVRYADGVRSTPGATITGLAAGAVIKVRVAAISSVGTGAFSAVSNAVSSFDRPGAPTGVSATPADAGLHVSWLPPLATGGTPVTSYTVEYRPVLAPAIRVQPRIVGGATTTIDQVPWQVAVFPGNALCGGSLLTSQWVITAAHCMSGEVPATVKVHSGLDTLSSMTAQNELSVDQIIVHPSYDPVTSDNDIALLHLTTPASGTPIQLFDDPAGPPAGTSATISGWGTTSSGGSTSDQVRVATVNVLSGPTGTCGSYGTDFHPAVMVCAGVVGGGIDTCQGDSGGPLVVDVLGVKKLVGLTSFGNGCALAAFPGVYTRVSTFADWVDTTLNPWTSVTVSCSLGGSCTSTDLVGLANDVPYELRVSATNLVGTGLWSAIAGPFTPVAVP